MRILVISNIYPPGFIGGYELGAREIVDYLWQGGDDIQVLTSEFLVRVVVNPTRNFLDL